MAAIDAYIPASRSDYSKTDKHYPELLKIAGVKNKALIEFNGRPMISYAVEALDKANDIRSITIVGQTKDTLPLDTEKPLDYIPGGLTTFETTMKAVEHFQSKESPPDFILSLSSDAPLVTAEMINRITSKIDFDNTDREFFWNLVLKEDLDKHFPDVSKNPFRVKPAKFLTGDIQIFRPSAVKDREEELELMMGNRKSVFTIIRMFSIKYLFKYLIGWLRLDDIKERFKDQFDLDAALLVTEFPETCVDLDYAKDFEKFKKWMSEDRRKLGDYETVGIIESSKDLEAYLKERKTRIPYLQN